MAAREKGIMPSDTRTGWLPVAGMAVLIAGAVVACAGVLAPLIGLERYDFLVALTVLLGTGAVVFLVIGPSWVIITLFIVKMVTGHQFRSMFVLPFAGVEWAPRELWLALLLAHFAVKLVSGRAAIRPDLYHFFFYLYGFFFVLIAAVGVWYHPDIQEILKEVRFPVFLASYFVFASCAPTRANLWFYSRVILALAALIAAGGSLFFFYTLVTGNVINVQGVYGEYVRRLIGPVLFQSVRPNGHMFFEVCSVILVALLFCPAVARKWKAAFIALLALFGFAMLITMMRTAYVAFACSLAVLVFLSLPRPVRWPALFTGFVGLAAILLVFGADLYEFIRLQIPELGISLRTRVEEMAGAWSVFAEHPLFGAGMGSSFTGMGWVAKTSALAYGQWSYQTVHNVWMYFLLKGGLVGLTIVVFALGGVLARSYHLMEVRRDAFERFFLRGLLAAVAGQIIASLAMPRLTYPEGHVFLAMATAAFFILAQPREKRDGRDEADDEPPTAVP